MALLPAGFFRPPLVHIARNTTLGQRRRVCRDSGRRSVVAAVGRLIALGLLVGWTGSAATAERQKASQPDVPPVSMTCPMHPDVVETKPGTCPICKMSLIPMRLESVWTCPIHAVVAESRSGSCPICGRALIQVTVAVTWTCQGRPDINQIDRGTCPDGSPMVAQRSLRPHGNHNPQHGGQFFMAPDNFHHLEGTLPRPAVFRVYLYDDYARPLPIDQVKRITGRAVTAETFDSATRTTRETAAFPLVAARSGLYLEARVGAPSLPSQVSAKIRFKPDAPEYRFDFTFAALTMEPEGTPSGVSRTPALSSRGARSVDRENSATRGAPSAAASLESTAQPQAGPVADLSPRDAPGPVDEMLAQLRSQQDRIGELVRQGDFAAVWVPAFQAKDVAVALESRVDELPPDKRDGAGPAIARLVRTAWLLDAFGDIGNRQQIEDAYRQFASAVAELTEIFAK